MAWAAIRSIAETLGKEPEHFIAFNKGPIPFLAADESAPVPPCADRRRLSAWGRVRRVYRELVMLRDTLRAALGRDREAQLSAPLNRPGFTGAFVVQ